MKIICYYSKSNFSLSLFQSHSWYYCRCKKTETEYIDSMCQLYTIHVRMKEHIHLYHWTFPNVVRVQHFVYCARTACIACIGICHMKASMDKLLVASTDSVIHMGFSNFISRSISQLDFGMKRMENNISVFFFFCISESNSSSWPRTMSIYSVYACIVAAHNAFSFFFFLLGYAVLVCTVTVVIRFAQKGTFHMHIIYRRTHIAHIDLYIYILACHHHNLPNLLHEFSEQCFPKWGNSIVIVYELFKL